MSLPKTKNKSQIISLILLISVTVVIVTCGIIYFIYSRNNIFREEYSTLESIGEWKLQQIIDWRKDNKEASEVLLSDDIISHITELLNNENEIEAREHIMDRFQDIVNIRKIHFCSVLDANFETVITTHDVDEPLNEATISALIESYDSKKPVVSDFFRCSENDIHIDVVNVIYDSSQNAIAYLVFRVNAEDYLYPLVQTWPLKSDTSENLLFKVDGDDILFLNELRHSENTALKFRIPLTNKDLPAVQVAEGKKGIIIGNDYRDIKTIVYGSAVPETDWYLLSKVDYSEAFQGLRLQMIYISLIIVLLLIITPFIIMFFIKNHDYNISYKLYQVEQEKNKANEFFKFVINNIPQRIFWKDNNFNYIGCNAQFAKDRGYESEDDIIGLNDYDLFDKDEADSFRKIDESIIASLKPNTGYVDLGTLHGKEVWLRKNKIPVFDSDNNITGILCTTEDITTQKEIQDELNRHVKFLQTIYENINGLIFSFNDNGYITFIEGKLLAQLKVNSKDYKGRTISDVFPGEEVSLAITKSLKGDSASIDEYEIGSNVLNIFFQPVLDPNENVLDVYGIAVDISDLHLAIQNLERSNKELEQFAYIASHDLQEPLRMVSNFTQLLEQKYADKLDDKANKYIFYAVDGAKRMQTLINDLLNYSRINTREKQHKSVDMNEILKQVEHNMSATIDGNNAKIEYNTLPTIIAEPTQIYQLIQNLISNAIKFKKDKNPVIIVRYKDMPNFWQFEIKDNGIGIDLKYKDKIFQIFQRLHSKSEYSGTGIGLALCKRIAIKHGGDIWFESTLGEGTSFYFTIAKAEKENNKNESD